MKITCSPDAWQYVVSSTSSLLSYLIKESSDHLPQYENAFFKNGFVSASVYLDCGKSSTGAGV